MFPLAVFILHSNECSSKQQAPPKMKLIAYSSFGDFHAFKGSLLLKTDVKKDITVK